MKEEFIQRWFTHVPSTPHKENDKRLMIEDLEKLLEAQAMPKIVKAERLLKEALSCQNNDKDKRGICCQCREAINEYFGEIE